MSEMTRIQHIEARQDERFGQALDDYSVVPPVDGISETLTDRERGICDRLIQTLTEAAPVALLHGGLTPVPYDEAYSPEHLDNPMSGLSGRDLFVALSGPLFDLLEAARPGSTDLMMEGLHGAWAAELRQL